MSTVGVERYRPRMAAVSVPRQRGAAPIGGRRPEGVEQDRPWVGRGVLYRAPDDAHTGAKNNDGLLARRGAVVAVPKKGRKSERVVIYLA